MKRLPSTLALLTVLALTSACNQSDDYYEKAGFNAMGEPTDAGVPESGIPIVTLPDTEVPGDKPEVPPTPPVVGNPGGDIPESDLCKENPLAPACQLEPVVKKPGVVTILLALGDIAQQQVVITEDSSRLIAVNAVKYASPINNPKILVIKDYNHHGESPEDTEFIAKVLLSNYTTSIIYETAKGIKESDLVGYDLIWFNNPGHPMGNESTMKLLQNFKGGVVLSGDDLSNGTNFKTVALTGLNYIDNGATTTCKGVKYLTDNNLGNQFEVNMDQKFLAGIPASILKFEYGNDIDLSKLSAQGNYEVLATAKGTMEGCVTDRPVIIRYEK